jgi:hypothetical protein
LISGRRRRKPAKEERKKIISLLNKYLDNFKKIPPPTLPMYKK